MLSKAPFFLRDSVAPSVEQKKLYGEFGGLSMESASSFRHSTVDGVTEEDFSADIIQNQESR